jgi:hypothetical protein
MAASAGDIIKSWGRVSGIEPLPYIRIYANGAETKYLSLRGVIRPGLNNFTLAMQAIGATVTPSLSIYVPSGKEDPANFPWHEYTPIAPNELRHFSPAFGFYVKLVFSGKGQLMITSL